MKLLIGILYLCIYLTISAGDEEELVTLEFGEHLGDSVGPSEAEGVSEEINLSGRYKFYGREETSLFIGENGVISFREQFHYPFPQSLPLTSSSGTSVTPALIAGFWADIDVPKNDGAIFYIEMNLPRANGRFGRAKAKVLNLLYEGFGHSMEDFDPTDIFLATWEGVHQRGTEIAKRAVTFQIVLVTNTIQTYVLLLYSDVSWDMSNGHGVTVGFNAGDGVRSFTHPLTNGSILNLDLETNSRSLGAFVYRVDGNRIVEPTVEQRSEHICVKRFLGSRRQRFDCICPTEVRPRLAFNQINCLYELLAVAFKDDSPIVSTDGVTVYVSANRPGVELYCHIPKVDRIKKENCTAGVFERNNLLPGEYSLRIVAQDHHTNERAVLRGSFTILEETVREDGKEACGVTITNTGSAPTSSDVEIHFTGTGATSDFLCRVDQGNRNPCESPFIIRLTDLTPGVHRVVVRPTGSKCSSIDASSVRFTVAE